MNDEKYVAQPFSPTGNLGRRLREIYGTAHGALDERMIELLHQLDFIPSCRARTDPRAVESETPAAGQ